VQIGLNKPCSTKIKQRSLHYCSWRYSRRLVSRWRSAQVAGWTELTASARYLQLKSKMAVKIQHITLFTKHLQILKEDSYQCFIGREYWIFDSVVVKRSQNRNESNSRQLHFRFKRHKYLSRLMFRSDKHQKLIEMSCSRLSLSWDLEIDGMLVNCWRNTVEARINMRSLSLTCTQWRL